MASLSLDKITAQIASQIQKIPTKTRLIGFGVFVIVLLRLFYLFFSYTDDHGD